MRNSLRFVFNPHNNHVSYFFKNEQDKWVPVSRSSPLSRLKFSKVQLDGTDDEKLKTIIKSVNEIYNKNNNGLDILFEGSVNSFKHLNDIIKNVFPEQDIICSLNKTDIVIMGKRGVGKTELIKSIGALQGCRFNEEVHNNYRVFEDSTNNVRWYEINGLIFPIKDVDIIIRIIENLTKGNLTDILYCINSTSNRIERVEESLITNLITEFPKITVSLVLTNTLGKSDNSRIFVDEVEKQIGSIKVIPVLAKDYEFEIDTGETVTKKSYGIDKLLQYLLERRQF